MEIKPQNTTSIRDMLSVESLSYLSSELRIEEKNEFGGTNLVKIVGSKSVVFTQTDDKKGIRHLIVSDMDRPGSDDTLEIYSRFKKGANADVITFKLKEGKMTMIVNKVVITPGFVGNLSKGVFEEMKDSIDQLIKMVNSYPKK